MTVLNTPEMNISGIWGNIYSLSVLFTCLVSLLLSVFVLVKGRRERLNQFWFLLTLSVAGWAFCIFLWSRAAGYPEALGWNRAANLFVIFLAMFSVVFTEEYAKSSRRAVSVAAAVFGTAIFAAALFFPSLYIPSLSPKAMFRLYPDSGPLYYVHTAYFILCWTYAFLRLFHLLRTSSGMARRQARLIIAGLFISILGGSVNFLPLFGVNVFPATTSFTAFYVVLTTVAIIRYRAFEIDTVIHRTFLWALTSALIMLPMGLILWVARPFLSGMSLPVLTLFAVGVFYVNLVLYRFIQPQIDHVFRRRQYDYQMLLVEISRKLGSELNMDILSAKLLAEFRNALYVRNGLILIPDPTGGFFTPAGSFGYTLNEIKPLPRTPGLSECRDVLDQKLLEKNLAFSGFQTDVLSWMKQNRIEILIPLVANQKTVGMLGLGLKDNLRKYTNKDIEILGEIGIHLGVTLENALNHAFILDRERIAGELRLGREIQIKLLPQSVPAVDGLRLAGLSVPAMEIGGDYYDFFIPSGATRPDNSPFPTVSVVIGDVSGKGVGAGLIMAAVQAILKELSRHDLSPRLILSRTNDHLLEYTRGGKFMTMLYLVWDGRTRRMIYSSAGHEHIIVWREKTGDVDVRLSGGFLLGVSPDIADMLEDNSLDLERGDKLVLYTDGVTEAAGPDGEMFGLDRLVQAVRNSGRANAQEVLEALQSELARFTRGNRQTDDITMVILEAV